MTIYIGDHVTSYSSQDIAVNEREQKYNLGKQSIIQTNQDLESPYV